MNNELHAKTDQHVKEKKDTKIRLQDRIMRMKVKKTEKKTIREGPRIICKATQTILYLSLI